MLTIISHGLRFQLLEVEGSGWWLTTLRFFVFLVILFLYHAFIVSRYKKLRTALAIGIYKSKNKTNETITLILQKVGPLANSLPQSNN